MKKIRNGKWIVSLGAAIMFLFSFIFSTGGGIFGVTENGELPSDPITASAEDAALNSKYDALVDGSSYYYSDQSKINAFRTGSIDTDVSTQEVDRSATHGTAANPFVINTVDQWNAFAADTANATKATNVFVLGADIDFSGKTFKPVPNLSAKFYGTNHILSNISYAFGSAAGGLFKVAAATAVITDMSLKNVNFTGIDSDGGFICGTSAASVLNCHVIGKLTGVSRSSRGIGGIIGNLNGGTVNIYRCSLFADFTLDGVHDGGVGGIFGDILTNTNINVYDCLVIAKYKISNQDLWFGGIGAAVNTGGGKVVIENCIAYSNVLDTTKSAGTRTEASLFNGWLRSTDVVSLTIKNCSSAGNLNYASKDYDMYGVLQWNDSLNYLTVSATNYNWYAKSPYVGGAMGCTNKTPASGAMQWNGAGSNTRENMWLNGISNATFSEKIWMNKAIVNDAYMTNTDVTSTSGYTIENSPVRNPLKVTVSYYNYKNGGDVAFDITKNEPQVVKAGNSLYTPTADETGANRKFLGWTTDKSGQSEPFKAVPSNMLGDNKLYAVWELDQKSVEITATGSGGDFAFDTAAKEASMTYNAGGGITLTADLITSGMSDPEIVYQWEKDGTAIESGGTAQDYTVENVRESGDYTVSLKIKSTSVPLFRGEVKATPVKAIINPAPLECVSITFENGRPYSGAPYNTANPVATVQDKSGNDIKGATKWASIYGTYNGEGSIVADGKETKKVVFTLDEEYNGNYGESVEFEVTFKIEYLTFTFSLPEYNKLELKVNLEYNQNYTYNNIASMFEEVFAPYMSDKTLAGYSPVFLVNGQRVKINDYRKMGSTAYPTVKESYSLTVDFDPQTYRVTYDPRNGEDPFFEEIGHGIRLSKPTDPALGVQLFLGWFYVFTDDEGNESERAWNFDADRVTRETDLYAKWLDADTLVELKVDILPFAEFNVREAIDPSMLTVKAVFEGSAEGQTKKLESVLTFDEQYKILYVGAADNKLHRNANGSPTQVIISYTYRKTGQAAQTKEYTLELEVNPIVLDTSKLKPYFQDKAVVYNGSAHSIEINQDVNSIIHELKNEVEYRYVNSGGEVVPAGNVIGIDTYTVYASFKPTHADFEAPEIQATLSIIAQKIMLEVTWDNTQFVYNGKVQVPTPTFKDDRGNEIKPNYELTGDTNAIDANSNAKPEYSVTIVLSAADVGYGLAMGQGTVKFTIAKATVAVPKQIKEFEYRGKEFDLNNLDPDLYLEYFEGFDPALMKVSTESDATGKDARRYNASVSLLNPACSEWDDGTSGSINMPWSIKKARLTVNWDKSDFVKNNGVQAPQVISFYTLYGDDKTAVDYRNDIQYTGDIAPIEVGNYTISVIIKSGVEWANNYELDETKDWSFVIVPKSGLEILTVKWDSEILFKFNGEVQRPAYKIVKKVNENEIDFTETMRNYIQWNDAALKSKWAGDYEAVISLNAAGSSKYYLSGETSCIYTIALNDNGEGTNPDNNGGGDNPITGTVELPLWQLIVGGVSAVLFLICTARSFGEYGKYKAAKKEAKELAAVSYSVTYGFAPLPLLAISFLGASETVWTAVACAALGLFLLSLAAMLILGKKRKAAELVLRREKARVEEEKEYARQEEQQRRDEAQQRRDEELRMMFAAMQQNYQQPQVGYDDMQNMIASAVTALLPGLQQSMQALPPAQSDANAYSAPQQNSEADDLRAQMAAQQAQMAQQQELINQLLQNQAQAASAQAYNEAAAAADEAFWIDESEKIVSLEELYGKLSDDAKRCYYEIGSYIMNKPQTMQNDGKYAVLFKYRGKTLFKLCIKEDAPVLYYATEEGGKSEVKINSAEALEAARKVVDLRIAQTDSQM